MTQPTRNLPPMEGWPSSASFSKPCTSRASSMKPCRAWEPSRLSSVAICTAAAVDAPRRRARARGSPPDSGGYRLVPLYGFTIEERDQVKRKLDSHEKEILRKAEKFWKEKMLMVLSPTQRQDSIRQAQRRSWLSSGSFSPLPMPTP